MAWAPVSAATANACRMSDAARSRAGAPLTFARGALPLSAGSLGIIPEDGRAWTPEENLRLLRLVFSRLEESYGAEGLPSPEVVESLGRYPATTRCR